MVKKGRKLNFGNDDSQRLPTASATATKSTSQSTKLSPPPDVERQRQAIVVLGMHRSGTSALARVLNILGGTVPRTLIDKDESNAAGYWESLPIGRFNDRVLEAGGSTWHDWHRFNAKWEKSPVVDSFIDEAVELLSQEYGNAPLILLKDPRISVLFSFWLRVFERAGISPRCVIIARHPAEVSASLAKRNSFSAVKSRSIWLRYTLDAERFSRDIPRAFTTYDTLLQDFRALPAQLEERLNLHWPRNSDRVTGEISNFLSGSLRHHKVDRAYSLSQSHLGPWVDAVYMTLQKWSASGETIADRPIFDEVYNSFAIAEKPYGLAVRELDATIREVAELKILMERETNTRAETIEARVTALEKRLAAAEADRDEAIGEAGRLGKIVETENERRKELETAANESARLLSEESSKVARLLKENEGNLRAIEELTNGIAKLREDFEDAQKISEQALKARFDEIAHLTKAFMRLETAAAKLQSKLHDVIEAILRLPDKPWLPGRLIIKYKVSLLKNTGAFDPEWYLSAYSDVRDSGMDPADHYVRFGMQEGRSPLSDLSQFIIERKQKSQI